MIDEYKELTQSNYILDTKRPLVRNYFKAFDYDICSSIPKLCTLTAIQRKILRFSKKLMQNLQANVKLYLMDNRICI